MYETKDFKEDLPFVFLVFVLLRCFVPDKNEMERNRIQEGLLLRLFNLYDGFDGEFDRKYIVIKSSIDSLIRYSRNQ